MAARKTKIFGVYDKTQKFLDSLDWDELKKEFIETRRPDGTYRFRSVRQFSLSKDKWSENQQKGFVCCVGKVKHHSYPWKGDWEEERILETANLSKQVRTLKEKVNSELDLLEAGRILADGYLPFQQKIFNLWQELESYMGGRVILDESSATSQKQKAKLEDTNFKRMKMYMGAFNWIVDMKLKIDNQFLHALGWDRPQFLTYIQQMRNEQLNAGAKQNPTMDQAVNVLLMQLAQDQIAKAKMYELALPQELEEVAESIQDIKGKVVKE